jgi:hypothetical protein
VVVVAVVVMGAQSMAMCAPLNNNPKFIKNGYWYGYGYGHLG